MSTPKENQQTVEALAERIERLIDRYTGAPWQKRAYEAGTLGAFESGQAARAALRDLVAQADPEIVVEWCRELRDDLTRCPNPAEFLIWGKLFPPEALGPRCYDCAAKHVGHRNLGDRQVAIFDLRRLARLDGAR